MATTGSTRCEPRFATPRDERFPTLGPEVGEIARRLGKPLMPWQQDFADVVYEYDPETGLYRYDEGDVTVPRQSGKTTVTLAKKVHRLTILARRWGPQRSTYTAQLRLAARKKLEKDFAPILRSSRSFREITNVKARPTKQTEWKLSLNNGAEHIQFGPNSYLQIDAPSRTGGHGDTLDDGTIDEAFAHEDDTIEAGMRPAMATRFNAQLWVISTAGDHRSYYLWRKVLAGRAASEANEHGRVCYVEYSAPDDADPGDPQTWWACMPALGHTITEDFIRGEWERAQRKGQEGIDTFRRAYLNQWPKKPVLLDEEAKSVIPVNLWMSLFDAKSERSGPIALAVDAAPGGAWASIAAYGGRADGLEHAELVDHRAGLSWVVARLLELNDRKQPCAIALDPASSAGSLLGDLQAKGLEILTPTAREVGQASQALADAVTDQRLRHRSGEAMHQALLDAVKGAKTRPLGDAWAWNRRDSSTVISPLVAVTLARWAWLKNGTTATKEPFFALT